MDITYVSNRKKFNYRVCAIIISNNKTNSCRLWIQAKNRLR